MQKFLIFIGSRKLMRQLALIAELNEFEILGILDHHYWGNTESIGGVSVIGDERWLLDPNNSQAQEWLQNCDFFAANWWHGNQSTDKNNISMQELRKQRISILKQSNARVTNLIHPSSLPPVSKYTDFKIGQGVFIDAECWISIDQVEIGDFCGIEVGSRISHDTILGENVLVGPEVFLCDCNVGSNSFIGTRSCTSSRRMSNINIGKNSTVWAGAEVTRNIPDNSIYTNNNRIFRKFDV